MAEDNAELGDIQVLRKKLDKLYERWDKESDTGGGNIADTLAQIKDCQAKLDQSLNPTSIEAQSTEVVGVAQRNSHRRSVDGIMDLRMGRSWGKGR